MSARRARHRPPPAPGGRARTCPQPLRSPPAPYAAPSTVPGRRAPAAPAALPPSPPRRPPCAPRAAGWLRVRCRRGRKQPPGSLPPLTLPCLPLTTRVTVTSTPSSTQPSRPSAFRYPPPPQPHPLPRLDRTCENYGLRRRQPPWGSEARGGCGGSWRVPGWAQDSSCARPARGMVASAFGVRAIFRWLSLIHFLKICDSAVGRFCCLDDLGIASCTLSS